MALITFTSPIYRDRTVYGVAGSHTETLLKLALANKIPINFDCQDGQCGRCVVRVSSIDEKPVRMGAHLTDKEIQVLREIGKMTREELERVVVEDLPCEWRLACQMIVRDEDVLVEY